MTNWISSFGLPRWVEDAMDEVEVVHLGIGADVVDLAGLAIEQHGDDGRAMVLDVNPVAHVQAIAVDGQRAVADGVDDHERDQFLRELVGAVIVRAAGDDHLLAVGLVKGEREQIGAGLAGGIRGAGGDGRLLGEPPLGAERAVDFVRGDLDEAADAVPPRGIQQDAGADDVGMDEILRGIDAAVHVGLGGEIDDGEELVLAHQLVHEVGIGDVRVEELVALAVLGGQAGDVGDIARVGQRIHVGDEFRGVMFQDVADEVAADKAAAAGNEQSHGRGFSRAGG